MSKQPRVELLLELKNKADAAVGKAHSVIVAKLQGTQNALDKVAGSASGVFDKLENKIGLLATKNQKLFAGMEEAVPGLANKLGLLINPYTLIAAGVAGVGIAMTKASSMAMDWEKGMAKANVTMQLSKGELSQVSDKIKAITASSYVSDINQVPDAFNRLVSSGMATNVALDALKPTLDAAKAGFADVDVVAAAAAGTMNASGIKDATKVYDVLFATLNKGNAEFNDIANYLPKIIPMAKSAGISLEDTAGAFAYLTAQGFKAEAAATGMQNVFKSLSDKRFIDGFNKIGVSIFDAQGKMLPLVNVVDQLNSKMQGLTDEQRVLKFDAIGLDMEASTALSSMMVNSKELANTIAFTNNSAGQLNMALQNSVTTSDRFAQIGNAIAIKFVEFGELINANIVNPFLDAAIPVLQSVWLTVTEIGGAIWQLVQPIINGVWNALKGVWAILQPIVQTIFTIITAVVDWAKKLGVLEFIGNSIAFVFNSLGAIFTKVGDLLNWVYENTIKPIVDTIETAVGWVADLLGFGGDDNTITVKAEAPQVAGRVTGGIQGFDPATSPLFQNGQIKTTEVPGAKVDLMGANAKMPKIDAPKIKNDKVQSIVGSSQKPRDIRVDIKNVVEKWVTESVEFSKMTKADVERYLTDIIVRTIRSIESSYA